MITEIAEKRGPVEDLRPCVARFLKASHEGAKTEEVEGRFHGFFPISLADGSGIATAALIELPDGKIICAAPDIIQFLDKEE